MSCGVAPDEFYVEYERGSMEFSGQAPAWSGFDGDTTEAYAIGFTWYLHRPVADELRALRNDMRVRAHEATVEEEAEKEKAEPIAEAAAKAREIPAEEPPGRWDWLFANLEVWVAVLAGVLTTAFGIGKWVERQNTK